MYNKMKNDNNNKKKKKMVSCMHADLDFDRAQEIINDMIQRRKRKQGLRTEHMKDEDPERRARS
jgi:hypothetical protein